MLRHLYVEESSRTSFEALSNLWTDLIALVKILAQDLRAPVATSDHFTAEKPRIDDIPFVQQRCRQRRPLRHLCCSAPYQTPFAPPPKLPLHNLPFAPSDKTRSLILFRSSLSLPSHTFLDAPRVQLRTHHEPTTLRRCKDSVKLPMLAFSMLWKAPLLVLCGGRIGLRGLLDRVPPLAAESGALPHAHAFNKIAPGRVATGQRMTSARVRDPRQKLICNM